MSKLLVLANRVRISYVSVDETIVTTDEYVEGQIFELDDADAAQLIADGEVEDITGSADAVSTPDETSIVSNPAYVAGSGLSGTDPQTAINTAGIAANVVSIAAIDQTGVAANTAGVAANLAAVTSAQADLDVAEAALAVVVADVAAINADNATQTELDAAVALIQSDNATQTELDAAIATINTALGLKVDQTVYDAMVALSATDAEVAAVVVAQLNVDTAQDAVTTANKVLADATAASLDALIANAGEIIIDQQRVLAADDPRPYINGTGGDIILTGDNAAALLADGMTLDVSTVTLSDHLFAGETALAPATAGEPTSVEIAAFALAAAYTNGIVYYTTTDTATDNVMYRYAVDNSGSVLALPKGRHIEFDSRAGLPDNTEVGDTLFDQVTGITTVITIGGASFNLGHRKDGRKATISDDSVDADVGMNTSIASYSLNMTDDVSREVAFANTAARDGFNLGDVVSLAATNTGTVATIMTFSADLRTKTHTVMPAITLSVGEQVIFSFMCETLADGSKVFTQIEGQTSASSGLTFQGIFDRDTLPNTLIGNSKYVVKLRPSVGQAASKLPAATGSGDQVIIITEGMQQPLEIGVQTGELMNGSTNGNVTITQDGGDYQDVQFFDVAVGEWQGRASNTIAATNGIYPTAVETLVYTSNATPSAGQYTHDQTEGTATGNVQFGDITVTRNWMGGGSAAVRIDCTADFYGQDDPVTISLPTGYLAETTGGNSWRDELNVSAEILIETGAGASVDSIIIDRDNDIAGGSPMGFWVVGTGDWVGEEPNTVVIDGALEIEALSRIQVSSLAVINSSALTHYAFDETRFSQGSDLSLSATGAILGLKAGKTYRMTAFLQNPGLTSGNSQFQIVDLTTSLPIGEQTDMVSVDDAFAGTSHPVIDAYYTPGVDTSVGISYVGGASGEIGPRSTFAVEELASYNVISPEDTVVTEWTSVASLAIGGTTTAPTKPTDSVERCFYKVVGKTLHLNWSMVTSSATGASNGSGDYLVGIPAGFTIDTAITGAGDPFSGLSANIGTTFWHDVGVDDGAGIVGVANSTELYLVLNKNGTHNTWSSSVGGMAFGGPVISFRAEIPIL